MPAAAAGVAVALLVRLQLVQVFWAAKQTSAEPFLWSLCLLCSSLCLSPSLSHCLRLRLSGVCLHSSFGIGIVVGVVGVGGVVCLA